MMFGWVLLKVERKRAGYYLTWIKTGGRSQVKIANTDLEKMGQWICGFSTFGPYFQR